LDIVMRLTRWVLLVTLGEAVGFCVPAAVGVATSGGAAVAWSLGMLPSVLGGLSWTFATIVAAGIGALILLTSLPIAQYVALRDHARRPVL
jgi:hypothetical protein